MQRLLSALDRLWFTPAPASRPALMRLLLGAYTLYYLGRRYRMFQRIAASDPGLFQPVGAVQGLDRPLPLPVFRALLNATLLAGLAFTLGWRYKVSGPLFSGLLLWLLSYRNSWSMIYHNDNILVLHALVLGLAPAADALSLDARAGRTPATGGEGGQSASHWRYGWPLQLINAVTTSTYALAGVAKLCGPLGWGWVSGEAMRSQIAIDGLRKELLGSSSSQLAHTLYPRVRLFNVLAVGSLLIELLAPLAVLSRRGGKLWAAGAFSMHWGIYALMKITFRYQLAGLPFVPFFEPERAVALLARSEP
ncbi:MAG: hypothetical protein OHK0015_05460 [Chloroflexi bacterium OHK40]